MDYPIYRCHKEVTAFKIDQIRTRFFYTEAILYPKDDRLDPVFVNIDYIEKHQPEAGGYWVRYDDGYESYSPATAFEAGYTRIK